MGNMEIETPGGGLTEAQASKLAGIETGADVTDATNVAAAGAVMDGDFTSNGIMERTAAGAYSVKPVGTTAGTVAAGDHTHAGASTPAEALTPQGRLGVPYAYDQLSGATSVALTNTNSIAALLCVDHFTYGLTSISIHVAAVSVQGDLVVKAHHDNGSALHLSGYDDGNSSPLDLTMTSDSLPSPYVAAFVDLAGASAEEAGFEAYKAFNKSHGANDGVKTSSWVPGCLTLDVGEGITKTVNRIGIYSYNSATRSFPKAFVFSGSNVANPTKHTDGDWTALVTKTVEGDPGQGLRALYCFENATGYRHFRLKVTDYVGSAMFSVGELELYEATAVVAPGDATVLATIDSGAGTGWIRATFEAYQNVARRPYFITVTPSGSTSISLSANRVNASHGSMPPVGSCSLLSADAGGTYKKPYAADTYNQVNYNIVLNSNASHAPQLHYGRDSGKYVPFWDEAAWSLEEIPVAGVMLDCAALTPETLYRVTLGLTGEMVTLGTSVDEITEQDGLNVLTTDATLLVIGDIVPITRNTAIVAPVAVADRMYVSNIHNRHSTYIGKGNPYSGVTTWTTKGCQWLEKIGGDDFKVTWCQSFPAVVLLTQPAFFGSASASGSFSAAIDDFMTYVNTQGGWYGAYGVGASLSITKLVGRGRHEGAFLASALGGSVITVSLWQTGGFGIPPVAWAIQGQFLA